MSGLSSMVRRVAQATGRALMVNLYRAVAATGIASTVVSVSGCYTYAARSTSDIKPNLYISAEINDAGRVALGQRVGPEVMRMDGQVVEQTDSSVQLMVSKVTYLNGFSDTWQGQSVSLRTQDIKSVTQRTYSKSRTALLIGAMAAGLILTVLTLSFVGALSGDSSNDKGTSPPPES